MDKEDHKNWKMIHLHPLSLPQDLLDALVPQPPRNGSITHRSRPSSPELPSSQLQLDLSAFSCTLCVVGFEDMESQRRHFKSDWHRLNLQLNQSNRPLITDEQKFIDLVNNLSDFTSASDSEDPDSEQDFPVREARATDELVLKLDQLLKGGDCDSTDAFQLSPHTLPQSSHHRSPLIWFETSEQSVQHRDGGQIRFGFYKAIFPHAFVGENREAPLPEASPAAQSMPFQAQDTVGHHFLSELRSLQRPPIPQSVSMETEPELAIGVPTWTFLMIGGGHFAGMVVAALPKLRHIGKNKEPEKDLFILQHKTFHRYTTRRKQGGGQSTHDVGGKGAAKSAGANLRRYNEQALQEDIRNLLDSWSSLIQCSSLIFIKSSKSNSKILFDYKESLLSRKDPRMRSLPFLTKRPTLNELKRCFNELTRVKVMYLTSEDLAQLAAGYREQEHMKRRQIEALQVREQQRREKLLLQQQPRKQAKVVMDPVEQLRMNRWERLIDIVKKGKLEAFKDFMIKYHKEAPPVGVQSSLSAPAPEQEDWFGMIPEQFVESNGCRTLLQIGSSEDQAALVEYLLVDCKCDPTVRTGGGGDGHHPHKNLTAYELCKTKGTRNVFRRTMDRYPDWWKWSGGAEGGARVPSALTEEMESHQTEKSKERRAKMKDRLRDRDRDRKEKHLKEEIEKENVRRREEEAELERRRNRTDCYVNRLGGGPSSSRGPGSGLHRPHIAAEVRVDMGLVGLSDDQRLRLERERRARAAEARRQ